MEFKDDGKLYKSTIAEVSTAFKNLYRYSSGNNGINGQMLLLQTLVLC
jgi:hypothetical protein